MLTSLEIYKLVEIETKVKLKTSSRKRKYVYARGIANVLCKEFTHDSFEFIGSITGQNHASVMNSIKAFKNTYIHYSKYHRDAFLKLREFILALKLKEEMEKEIEEEIKDEPPKTLEHINLIYKYDSLKNENALLKYQVKRELEDYKEEIFNENNLIALVVDIPPEKRELAHLRIAAIVKML